MKRRSLPWRHPARLLARARYAGWRAAIHKADIAFTGCEIDGELAGVIGIQPVGNIDLIPHAYVLPGYQQQGVDTALMAQLRARAERQILVGT